MAQLDPKHAFPGDAVGSKCTRKLPYPLRVGYDQYQQRGREIRRKILHGTYGASWSEAGAPAKPHNSLTTTAYAPRRPSLEIGRKRAPGLGLARPSGGFAVNLTRVPRTGFTEPRDK